MTSYTPLPGIQPVNFVSVSLNIMPHLTPAQKKQILHLSTTTDLGVRDIAAKMHCSKSTVATYVSKNIPDKENSVGGQPKKLTPADEHYLAIQMHSGWVENATDLTQNINNALSSPITPQTTHNYLHKNNFKAVVKKKKPKLTAQHRKERLKFAQAHFDWTVDDWKRVIWSDETKINRFGSDGFKWVWKEKGDPLQE